MTLLQDIGQLVLIGAGATAVMDTWLLVLRRAGVPTLNFAHLGRWAGHLFRGRFVHAAIARTPPIAGELAWGWLAHYAIGISFAAALVAVEGWAWAQDPTLAPAVTFGLLTTLAPLAVLQPAMGAGFASSRTPTPVRNCLRSLANHTVFGLGLYLSATITAPSLR
ncbi:DUF2938 domain-containing protein [Methylibium sp.]|jgi:hypothetical protein|uniref:DUF2938 domain-containing protein n=1 Tax=Methylibium sp. TaxID=2067992 RepID=UPI00333F802E